MIRPVRYGASAYDWNAVKNNRIPAKIELSKSFSLQCQTWMFKVNEYSTNESSSLGWDPTDKGWF